MGIFGVGIFIDRWFFSLAWVFSPALARSRRRVGRRSGVDLTGYTGPFRRSSDIYVCIRISYTILGRKKKKRRRRRRRKEQIDIYSFLLLFSFLKINTNFGDVG
jgi:hypothetical protein